MADINRILGDKKKTWGAALFLILCALAFVILFKYDFGNFRKLRLAIAERKNSLVTLDSLGEYKKYLEEFTSILAPGEGTEWLMETLVEISRSEGVTLKTIKPSGTRISSGYKIITVSVEGVSSYEDTLRFIEGLEGRKECIFVEKASIRTAAGMKSLTQDKAVAFGATIASVAPER